LWEKEVGRQAVNIRSPDSIELKILAKEVRDQVALELNPEYESQYDAGPEHTYADTELTEELVGFEASHTIWEGLETVIERYEASREWCRPLVQR
jgi:nucleoside-diphosphate-sugar epimerase